MKYHISKVLIAFILAFSILLPITPRMVTAVATDEAIPVANETAATPSEEISIPTDMLPSNKKVSTAELTKDSQILKYIDETVFAAKEHVARLPEFETLSSYAFLNSDGTTTVYYMDKEVKYIDSDGKIVEKDISLTSTSKGYSTLSNDVVLELPYNPASGIVLSYDGYDISLIPQGGSLQKVAKSSENAVIYPDYFGTDMSLVYTPTLSGLKEEIVLSRYTGINTFSFRLNTDGLNLYSDNGRYYLAASETAEMRMDMGDVVTFDATGRFSIGTMEVETIKSGAEYVLTLTVDKDFLTAESTTYPVSIDPSLSVSDSTHGAGAIEDVSIYSGRPNANGDWTYLHCGYYDDTYQVARTLFRLTGLTADTTYQTVSASNILSAEFHIREATGSPALPVHLYANTGSASWTESGATWNNAGVTYGTEYYATASPASNSDVSYDITLLLKNWKNNSDTSISAAKGFVLVSSNETSLDKAFYSSEFSNTAYRPYVVVNYNLVGSGGGSSFAEAVNLPLQNTIHVQIAAAGERRYFKFTPPSTGFYTINSSNRTGDPKVWLYNPSQRELMSADDIGGGDLNFCLTYHLVTSKTYYFLVGCSGSGVGEYDIRITATTSSTLIETDSLNADDICTVDVEIAYMSSWYKFIAPQTGIYVFQSCSRSGDPQIWIYNSDYSYKATNDDGGSEDNFRLSISLTKGRTYYVVVGCAANTVDTYNFLTLIPATIDEYTYRIKSAYSHLHVDIKGPDEQEVVHQWGLHDDAQEQWEIQQGTDGSYTIRSLYGSKYYIGISNTSIGVDNIVLSPNITDHTKWNIYELSSGRLLFEPVMALGKVLSTPDSLEGTELQLQWADTQGLNTKWMIGGYDAFLAYHVPSRIFTLQSIGYDANNSTWNPLIAAAVAAWNNSGAKTSITLSPYDPTTVSPYGSIYTIEVGTFLDSWAGITTPVTVANSTLISATIKINSSSIPDSDEYSRSVITHEIGHLLGLVDDEVGIWGDASIMSYGRNRYVTFIPQGYDKRNVLYLFE